MKKTNTKFKKYNKMENIYKYNFKYYLKLL